MSENGEEQDIGAESAALAGCADAVARYRSSTFSRAEAIEAIALAVSSAEGGIAANSGAIPANIALLDEWDSERQQAGNRGPGPRAGEGGEDGGEEQEPEGESHEQNGAVAGRKDGHRAGYTSMFDRGPSSHFQRVERSTTPVSPERHASTDWSVLSTTQRTQYLQSIYSLNKRQALASLYSKYTRPSLHRTLWETVLLNDFLDFDRLNFESETLLSTQTSKFSIADGVSIEIGGGDEKRTKTVSDFGSWSILYDKWARAVVFAYPHRFAELEFYRAWMVNEFTNVRTDSVNLIINLDKACRRAAAEDQTFSLDNPSRLSAIEFKYTSPFGKGTRVSITSGGSYNDDGSGPSRRSTQKKRGAGGPQGEGQSRDVCRKWNQNRDCIKSPCPYPHRCSRCGGEHREPGCPKGSGRK